MRVGKKLNRKEIARVNVPFDRDDDGWIFYLQNARFVNTRRVVPFWNLLITFFYFSTLTKYRLLKWSLEFSNYAILQISSNFIIEDLTIRKGLFRCGKVNISSNHETRNAIFIGRSWRYKTSTWHEDQYSNTFCLCLQQEKVLAKFWFWQYFDLRWIIS